MKEKNSLKVFYWYVLDKQSFDLKSVYLRELGSPTQSFSNPIFNLYHLPPSFTSFFILFLSSVVWIQSAPLQLTAHQQKMLEARDDE